MNVGRNDPCPCGSGKKYKQCCLSKDEAAQREAARVQAEAVRAITPSAADLELPPLPEPPPRSPEEQACEVLWDEFTAAAPADQPPIFRRALAEGLLDDEYAYEMLAELRDHAAPSLAGALITELRDARPDLYQASVSYYLEWQIADALAQGRADLLPALADALAATAGDDLDMFYASSDRLAYHGQLALIADTMRRAWPLVRASNKFVPGADEDFAAGAQQLTMLAYVACEAAPRSDDPTLLAALEFFAPVDRALLAELLALLTGQEDRPWERADRSEDEQINRLSLRFQGEVYRAEHVPLTRGELGRVGLVNYIGERREARREGTPRNWKKALGAPTAASLLSPDYASLNHFLAQRLNLLSSRFYEAAATLELTPAWLRFLQAQELITAEQCAATLRELHRLVDEAAPIWQQHTSDLAVAEHIRVAWERDKIPDAA